VRSLLGVRLRTTAGVIGSLTLYDAQPGRFTAADRDEAVLLAGHAAVAMSSVAGRANLWRAIDSRQAIGQAQGILMERFALDGEQAFAVLRRYSQLHNSKLSEVAARLVATRRLPDG
jgi:GAF domain-containing protein